MGLSVYTTYIAKTMDVVLFPFLALNPALAVFSFSLLSTLTVVLASRFFARGEEKKKLRLRMNELKERIVKLEKAGKKDEIDKLIEEMLKLNLRFMRSNFKAMGFSLLVGVFAISWLSFHFSGMVVATLPISLPLIGNKLGWVYWYVLVSLVSGFLLNKLIGVSK